MFSLNNIGFYTLNDIRCQNASVDSQLMRCELILTDACTFKCPYCRGLRKDIAGTMSLDNAKYIVDLWAKDNLKNIRLSGGEPTIYRNIVELVSYIKSKGVERIAISTNGYSNFSLYEKLVNAGVNDFSISLDACCASFGDMMSGGVSGSWNKVIDNIQKLSKITYTTVGIVVTDETVGQLPETIKFASSLGVSDIRIISAAQYNKILNSAKNIDELDYNKYPILKYRINNLKSNRNVRGIKKSDSNKCGLVLDDMAVAGNYHFPCIIYMREQGNPIGKIGTKMRQERFDWMKSHNTHNDPICKKNCLDVCIDYNNKFKDYNKTDIL
jgi:molybdenum cofactor biosynthesis enzyme MoaA